MHYLQTKRWYWRICGQETALIRSTFHHRNQPVALKWNLGEDLQLCYCNAYGSGQPWTLVRGRCVSNMVSNCHMAFASTAAEVKTRLRSPSLTRPYETWWPLTLMVTVIWRSGWRCLYLPWGQGGGAGGGRYFKSTALTNSLSIVCMDNFRPTVRHAVSVAVAEIVGGPGVGIHFILICK